MLSGLLTPPPKKEKMKGCEGLWSCDYAPPKFEVQVAMNTPPLPPLGTSEIIMINQS